MFWFAGEGVVVNVLPDFAGAIGIICTAGQKETQGKNGEVVLSRGAILEKNLSEEMSIIGGLFCIATCVGWTIPFRGAVQGPRSRVQS